MKRIGNSLDDILESLAPEARMAFLVNRGIDPGSAAEQAARQIKALSAIAKDQPHRGSPLTKSESREHQWARIGDLVAQASLEEDADLFTVLLRAMKRVDSERPVAADKCTTRLVLFHEAKLGPVNLSRVKKCLDSWGVHVPLAEQKKPVHLRVKKCLDSSRVQVSLRHLRRIAERHGIQAVAPGRPRQNRTNDARHR